MVKHTDQQRYLRIQIVSRFSHQCRMRASSGKHTTRHFLENRKLGINNVEYKPFLANWLLVLSQCSSFLQIQPAAHGIIRLALHNPKVVDMKGIKVRAVPIFWVEAVLLIVCRSSEA